MQERRSARESAALRRFNTCRTVTSAITPLIATSTRVSFKGRRSMAGSLSTKKAWRKRFVSRSLFYLRRPFAWREQGTDDEKDAPDGSSVNVSCDPIRAIGLP